MTNNLRGKERENDLIGNILHDDAAQDFFNMRMEMGKSTSAPPPGLLNSLTSPSPDLMRGDRIDPTATEDYYNYYHSLKPHDPRLPLPKWKPVYHNIVTPVPQGGQGEGGDLGGFRKGSNAEKYGEMNNFASHFDQAMSLNMNDGSQQKGFMNKPSSPGMHYEDNKKSLQPRPVMQDNVYNGTSSPERRGSNTMQGSQQQYKQNQHHHQQNQGYNPRQHGGQHGGGQHQHGSHGHQNQNPRQQNMRTFDQGQGQGQGQQFQQQQQQQQFYPGMEQQMGGMPYYNPNFMNPQMQQNMYYGMNAYPNQMYPYGMDPMMQNQKPFTPMQGNQFGGNRMNQMGGEMGQMNQMGQMGQMGGQMGQMGQMGGGQYYNAPYGNNNFYPMGGFNQQQNAGQGNFQQGYGNNQHQNKPQKGGMNKNPAPKLDVKTVMAHLIENCRDQNGSRLIQQQFEKSNEQEKEHIFSQIIPHAYSLMTDVFGNYVIQKVLELGPVDQKLRLFEAMQGHIQELAKHTYGCRVVQRTLEELRSNGPAQDEVLAEISGDIISLIEDQNGNHVIQKCFETMPSEKVQFIIEEVTSNIDSLAFHPYGCRVIQRTLEHSPPEITAPMLNKLMSSAQKCCEDQYGNYIMQYILEKGPKAEKMTLLDVLKNGFVKLSMNKFASNVTEKSAIHGTPEFRRDVVNVLCNTYYDNKLSLVALMTHSFANYVVQRLFECSDDQLRQVLYDKMQQVGSHEEIKKSNYGKHVLTFIEKLMESRK